jgi:hypothetical protein
MNDDEKKPSEEPTDAPPTTPHAAFMNLQRYASELRIIAEGLALGSIVEPNSPSADTLAIIAERMQTDMLVILEGMRKIQIAPKAPAPDPRDAQVAEALEQLGPGWEAGTGPDPEPLRTDDDNEG